MQIPPPSPLPDIVVTGARLPRAAGEAAFSVIRLDADDLRRQRRLDEALAAVPAVSLFRRNSSLAANPTTQGISLRAIAPSGAGRTLVTLDGAPLNDPFGGWVIWSQVPTESLSGLDIVRGSGAGPYGAGALTGVIALRERDAGAVLDASVAERGGARVAGSGATALGPVRIVASGLYETSDGYVPVRGSAAGAADTPLDLEVRSAALRADLPLAEAVVSLRAAAFEEDRGSGLGGARATASGNSLSATAALRPRADRPGWRLQAWRRESDLANTSVAVSADRTSTTPANDQYETPAAGWGVNAALRRIAVSGVARVEWELGADARFNEGETRERFRYMAGAFTRDRVAGGETSVAGVYAEGSWDSGPWLAAGGLRYDGWRNENGRRLERDLATGLPTLDEGDPDRSGEVVSARLAVRRDMGGGQSVRLAGYTGFRPATLNELHRPFRVGNDLTEANAALAPERLTGVETGWAWAGERVSLTATAFWTRIEDAIVNVTIGAGPGTFPRAGFVPAGGVLRQRRNAGTIEATGVELDGRFELSDALSLHAALSATDARLDGGAPAPQLTGLRPAQAPIWSAVAALDWRPVEQLTLAADLRWESRRFEDDLNSRVLDAAVTVNMRAEWGVSPSATLWLAADNLLDADVETGETGTGVSSFGPPRTLSVGVRLSR
ncbi:MULTISPECIES: TonB-dependent receptor [unclassified Brevundimonas]|uniref:TonB-dependent receptor n=1 Tax=unclassified Brevundimonas TaxID=2622653 RepID=UPI0006F324A4|nr:MULTISPECIES: TonB-dependent receptor [unclassified Brevundimonas]KQY88034.1 TonB-dependent receptor [Brevundimonas sp. Root1423]KRA28667.1 TonB-dependent receptor [Brevundimonas sp. Root608]